jgi:hypothetical protein
MMLNSAPYSVSNSVQSDPTTAADKDQSLLVNQLHEDTRRSIVEQTCRKMDLPRTSGTSKLTRITCVPTVSVISIDNVPVFENIR